MDGQQVARVTEHTRLSLNAVDLKVQLADHADERFRAIAIAVAVALRASD
jgi:hypothetical protein